MDTFEVISAVLSVLSVLSLAGNIIPYTKKKEQNKVLIRMVQENYNHYYYIARSVTKVVGENQKPRELGEQIELTKKELFYIRGVCDSARESLSAMGREELKKQPFFEHPAYPGKQICDDEMLMGKPIDEVILKKID